MTPTESPIRTTDISRLFAPTVDSSWKVGRWVTDVVEGLDRLPPPDLARLDRVLRETLSLALQAPSDGTLAVRVHDCDDGLEIELRLLPPIGSGRHGIRMSLFRSLPYVAA